MKHAEFTLAEYGEGEHQKRTITITNRTVTVGRGASADITIRDASISKQHAKLEMTDDVLKVEDLGSTNGTFLNGKRISEGTVDEGDLLQFANALYRVGRNVAAEIDDQTITEGILPWAETLIQFDELISNRAVNPHFQPIVSLHDRSIQAYEVLARSSLSSLANPAMMFGAAERLGQQVPLSEVMREEGIRHATGSNFDGIALYLNTHPDEVVNERFIDSLHHLRTLFPQQKIMIEIHEGAVTNPEQVRSLCSTLKSLEMGLSYDDFGAGQGRLLELGEVPPDVLKFDMSLIRDIDQAPASRQDLLRSLVKMAIDVGATPLTEGVETAGEHQTCVEMGFVLGQGFLYGRPAPNDSC